MPSCAGMHNARWKQGKSLAERREFRRFFQGKVLDKKQRSSFTTIVMDSDRIGVHNRQC